jgi:cobalt/nickel transport system permease protein
LTIAGMAEMTVTAGLMAWLQKSHPSLLGETATGGWRVLRPLLAGLALLLLLTPLGILAVGTAWGEWAPSDFTDAAARRQIAAASGNQALPLQVPTGLERLSSAWTAPFPDYAPPLLRHPWLGYLLSGAFGMGLIVFSALIVEWALSFRRRRAQ